MNYFLDTNICIYFLKGKFKKIVTNLKIINAANIKIPAIVKAELLYGVYKSANKKSNLIKVQRFLQPFQIIPFDEKAAENYASVRSALEKSGKIIGPNDLIIAASVLANNGILVTNNEDEFKRVPKLRLKNWTK